MKNLNDMSKEELIEEIKKLDALLKYVQPEKQSDTPVLKKAKLKTFDHYVQLYKKVSNKIGEGQKEIDFKFDSEDYIILGHTLNELAAAIKLSENKKLLFDDFGKLEFEKNSNVNFNIPVDDRSDLQELLRIAAFVSAASSRVKKDVLEDFIEETQQDYYYLEHYQIKAIVDCDQKGKICQDIDMYAQDEQYEESEVGVG